MHAGEVGIEIGWTRGASACTVWRSRPARSVRLTQEEVVGHPLWRDFGPVEAEHPPMRGWLASSVCGEDGWV